MLEVTETARSASRVLIVEDEAVVALDVRHRLAKLGYATLGVAATGEQALEMAAHLAPDLILMDIMLAGAMDGVEAAAAIRQRFDIPIVYLTAHTDRETLQRAGATGPHGYVIKPFENRELHTAVEIALYKSRMERRLVENERWMATTLKSLGEGLLTTDPDGRVRFVNPVAETLLGLSLEQARGQVLEAIYRLRPHPLAVPGEADRGLAMLCRADGRSIPVEETRSPILDDRGGRLGTAVVFRDVSQRQRAEEALSQSLAKLRHTLDETVNALTVTSEKRDPFTAGHQERVSRLAVAIAAELGLPEEAREGVRVAGLVHDIGKIHVPSEILAKPEALSDMEMGIVKHHCEVGREILQNIPFPWPVARMVLEHHERLDGSGYPAGLVGNAALVESRILAVADVVEAMNAHRPYRAALGLARALEELRTFRGALYDPDVVDACLRLFQTSAFAF